MYKFEYKCQQFLNLYFWGFLFIIPGPPNSGKTCAVRSIALALGLHLLTVNGSELTGDTPSAAESRIKNTFAKVCGPSDFPLVAPGNLVVILGQFNKNKEL